MWNNVTSVPAAILAILAALACLPSGCAREEKTVPISGLVHVNGKPADGVYVVFHPIRDPKQSASPTSARTGKDGAFTVRIPGSGDYAVTAFWPQLIIDTVETVEGEDRFRGKYRSVDQPAAKVTIMDGANSLPTIQLKHP